MKNFLGLLLMFSLLVPSVHAGEKVFKYEVPDVKEVYCGPVINYQYCKCAFHNELCDVLGINRGAARTYVLDSFREWNKEIIQRKAEVCIEEGDHWDPGNWSCTECTDGDVFDGSQCVPPGMSDAEKKECEEALKNFDEEWVKYSDIGNRADDGISYEVQQFNTYFNDTADLIGLAQEVEYEITILQELRKEHLAYKAALVQNIRVNLLKSFWRLTYVTYTTVQGARGAKGTIEKLIDPSSVVQGVGAGMKLVQSHIPPHAKDFQIDTDSTTGKIKSITWNATLEAMESVGNPSDIAQQVMKDARGAVIPSPNISDEEVAILRDQHLSNKGIDKTIAELDAELARLRKVRFQTRVLIAQKYLTMQEWKQKEYERVKWNIEEQCKEK